MSFTQNQQSAGSPWDITFTTENPSERMPDIFRSLGMGANRFTNPWLRFVQENITPGLSNLFMAQGQQDPSAFAPFMRSVISGSGMAGGGPGWMNLDSFRNLVTGLFSGGLPGGAANPLWQSLSNLDAENQAQQLASMLQAGGAMAMMPLARQAMMLSLRNQLDQYLAARAAGQIEPSASFLDYLGRTGFIQSWFDPRFVYSGGAPRYTEQTVTMPPAVPARAGSAGASQRQPS